MKRKCSALLTLMLFGLLLGACGLNTPTISPNAPIDTSYPAGEISTPTTQAYPLGTPTAKLTAQPTQTATVLELSASVPFISLHMFPDGTGWASHPSNSAVYHTSDGGLNWVAVYESPGGPIYGEFYLDGSTAWLSCSDYGTLGSSILHTTDAGATWSKTSLDFTGGKLYFLDKNVGFMFCGDRLIENDLITFYSTRDGGQTWDQSFTLSGNLFPNLQIRGLKPGITFRNALEGWVTGTFYVNKYSYLYHTADGGATWTNQSCDIAEANPDAFFYAFPPVFFNANEGLLALNAYLPLDSQKTILCKTTDGGESWKSFSEVATYGNVVEFTDAQHIWILGQVINSSSAQPELYRSIDGGTTWQNLNSSLPDGYFAINLDFTDSEKGWLIMDTVLPNSSKPDHYILYASQDGGQTWSQLDARMGD